MDQYGEVTTYKIGYDEYGVAKAVSFDNKHNVREEKNFAKFIGDNFKAKTEKDPDYMENLGSKEIITDLQRYCSDPKIIWFGGNLSSDELTKELKAKDEAEKIKVARQKEYYKQHHSKEARGGYASSLIKAIFGK